jgi:hypothetical protein
MNRISGATKRARSLVYVAAVAVIALSGCTSRATDVTNSATPRYDPRPLENSAPYWCKMIPQEALNRMTGNLRWTAGPDYIDIADNGGKCYVNAPARHQRMSLDVEAGRAVHLILDGVRKPSNTKRFRDFPGRLTLGAGVGHVTRGSPFGSYWAYALFSCDQRDVAFDLSISIGPGRDLVSDVSAMMTIAQRRYALLAKCDLGPPDKKLVPFVHNS